MIEIKSLGEWPVQQECTQKIVVISRSTLYTDGSNKYVDLCFTNNFVEALYSLSFELTQFDEEKNIIKTEKYDLEKFYCPRKTSQVMESPIKVEAKFASAYVRLLAVTFSSVIFKNDAFLDPFEKEKPEKKKPSAKYLTTKEYFVRAPIYFNIWLVAFLCVFFVVILTILISCNGFYNSILF